jgi:hypothetical protein
VSGIYLWICSSGLQPLEQSCLSLLLLSEPLGLLRQSISQLQLSPTFLLL